MVSDEIIAALEKTYKDACEQLSSSASLETSLLSSTIDYLKDSVPLRKQLDEANRQVQQHSDACEILNQRVTTVEREVCSLRDKDESGSLAAKIMDLESELAKRSSDGTSRVRNELVQLEIKHRDTLRSNRAMQDLWADILTTYGEGANAMNWKQADSTMSLNPLADDNETTGSFDRQKEAQKPEGHSTGAAEDKFNTNKNRTVTAHTNEYSNPAFLWYADVGVDKTFNTVQSYLDAIHESLEALHGSCRDIAYMQQAFMRSSLRNPLSLALRRLEECDSSQHSDAESESEDGLFDVMESLDASVQHLLELLPTGVGVGDAGTSLGRADPKTITGMEFQSFEGQAACVLQNVLRLQECHSREYQQFQSQQEEDRSSCQALEQANSFQLQVSSLASAVRQLLALLSVYLEQTQKRESKHVEQLAQQLNSGFGSTPVPGVSRVALQACVSGLLSLLSSHGYIRTKAKIRGQASKKEGANVSLEQLLHDFIASKTNGIVSNGLAPSSASTLGRWPGMGLERTLSASSSSGSEAGSVGAVSSLSGPEGDDVRYGEGPDREEGDREPQSSTMGKKRDNEEEETNAVDGHATVTSKQPREGALRGDEETVGGAAEGGQAAEDAGDRVHGVAADKACKEDLQSTAQDRAGTADEEKQAGQVQAPEERGARNGTVLESKESVERPSTPRPEALDSAALACPRSLPSPSVTSLPGPAKLMQMIISSVRTHYGSLLAECQRAEDVVHVFYMTAQELQVSQDQTLLASALYGRLQRTSGSKATSAASTPVKPFADGRSTGVRPSPLGQRQVAARELVWSGSQNGGSAGAMGVDESQGESTGSQPSADLALKPEDYEAEIAEMRAIAYQHAEFAAALQELLSRMAEQHTAATLRVGDLDVRMSMYEKEAGMLRNENTTLTRALVEVKVAYAEKQTENMRLAQGLRRCLKIEQAAQAQAGKG